MDFSEEHTKLLGKEWLVKIDTQHSTPYLIKFGSSTADLSCCVLITDTKTTWAETLTSKQFARRWRNCNRIDQSLLEDEELWRKQILDLLTKVHTLGGIKDLAFERVESNFSDLAFELECEAFKWRWEVVFVGHKASAEILSRHLIMPLVSLNHLAFASADPVSELSEDDLEKAVDKMARTARRTVDTHVRNAIAKPRVATTIQRVTAMFNFASDLPAIVSTAETQELQVPVRQMSPPGKPPSPPRSNSPPRQPNSSVAAPKDHIDAVGLGVFPGAQVQDDSATDSDSEYVHATPDKGKGKAESSHSHPPGPAEQFGSSALSPLPVAKNQIPNKDIESASEDSPPRPTKKARPPGSSSDDDSEAERKKRATMLRGSGAPKRGTKQPIKRGGKRF